MWYQNSFRRHLCDMHIEDWDPRFLSRFDPEAYVGNLMLAKLQNAMVYFQSHVGLCYYPTESGKLHNAFVGREDMMRRVVELCHEAGITVTGYYSLIYNTWAHDAYPEWRMLGLSGQSSREEKGSRYGFCCPNKPAYRDFVRRQIEEMASYVQVEGMFYDMLFWPHMCYCDQCRARWARDVGGELPTVEDWKDPRWLLHMRKRREWMGEFAQWVTDLTKRLMPGVSVEHNCAFSALPGGKTANAEEVIAACDYVGGDLYKTMFTQSLTCKFYRSITNNQPFEYMFSRCAPGLSAHTQIKSRDIMLSAMALTAAHHGATLVIDAIDPVGTMDERVYRQLGEVFDRLIPYDAYMTGEPIEDVGLYYSLKSKFNAYDESFTNYTGVENTVETMVAKHILCGVTGGFHSIEQYPVVIASCLTEEDSYDYERLISYVRDGGVLYFSGGDCKGLLKCFFDAEVTGRTEESVVYLSPRATVAEAFGHYNATYPLNFRGTAPIVKGIADEDVVATVTLPYTVPGARKYASIHSNPPGIPTDLPAMATKCFGKGRVIWSAVPIECLALYDYRDLLLNLLGTLTDFHPTLSCDAADDVELTAFQCEHSVLVHAVLMNTKPIARRVEPFRVSLTCDRKPIGVRCAPDGEEVRFTYEDGAVVFTTVRSDIFQTYEILFEGGNK